MPARDDEEGKVQSFPVSLSSAQIADAVSRSPDGGITLFLSRMGLSDIGAHEATELAIAGRKGRQENDSVVERYDSSDAAFLTVNVYSGWQWETIV